MKPINNKLLRTLSKHGGDLVNYISKNSPTILTGCAIAGAFVAVGCAVKATKPALKHIEEVKNEHRDRIVILRDDEREDYELTEEELDSVELKPLEIIQACWKDYIPTAIALVGTTACVIGAHSISAKRTAAMAALYTMSEQALKDYTTKAEEIVGKGKSDKIKDAVAEEQLKRHPYDPNTPLAFEQGDVLCFDQMTGRYFSSNMQKIRTIMAELNAQIAYGERISLNDFYYALGIDGIQFGEDAGWCVENQVELEFTSSLTSNGTPVLAIRHKNQPTAWYYT